MRPLAGVYFVRYHDLVKIGWSWNVWDRFASLKMGSPVDLDVIGVIESISPAYLEAVWHRRWAALRHHGEWFKLTPELLAAIERETPDAKVPNRRTRVLVQVQPQLLTDELLPDALPRSIAIARSGDLPRKFRRVG